MTERAGGDGLTPDLERTLLAIGQLDDGPGAPVAFAQIDWELDKLGIDARQTLLALTPAFVRRQSTGPHFALDEMITLTVRGLAQTPSGVYAANDVVYAVQRLAQYAADSRPVAGDLATVVTLDQMASVFQTHGLRAPGEGRRVAKRVLDTLAREPHIFESVAYSEDQWSGTISRDIRRFRGVTTIEQYLEVQRGLEPGPLAPIEEETALTEQFAADIRSVFVIHGRDSEAKLAVEQFLRHIDLAPIDWESDMVAGTGTAAPYTGDVVRQAFTLAHAVIILLTPEEHFRLHPDFYRTDDAEGDREGWQPRPNVYFEAGMAFALHPDRTIIVEIGRTRPASDFGGRHAVRLDGTPQSLDTLALRLENANCPVRRRGGWLDVSSFQALIARSRDPLDEVEAPAP